MKFSAIFIVLFSLIILPSSLVADTPQLINFQGKAYDSGGGPLDGTFSIQFRIYDAASGGSSVWSETQSAVQITDGLFHVLLGSVNPIVDSVFESPDRYLGVKIGSDPEMTPRTRIATVPYSYRVASVDSATGGHIKGDLSVGENNQFSSPFVNNSVMLGENNLVSGPAFAIGYNNKAQANYASVSGGNGNEANGTVATVGGGSSNIADSSYSTIAGGNSNEANSQESFIGGGGNNSIAASSRNATITGGGVNQINANAEYASIGGGQFHTIEADYGHIGGGYSNNAEGSYSAVSGGQDNSAIGVHSYIGGGLNSVASGESSVICGGEMDTATGKYSLVCGGQNNNAEGIASSVLGGTDNKASALRSTVVGGGGNTAAGVGSLAAGRDAEAMHIGTFVWNDGFLGPFSSTDKYQFLVNSSGGFGLNITTPKTSLHVLGSGESEFMPASALQSETVVFEDQDAILGLYSKPQGSVGSALTFGEVSNGSLDNKWTLIRETASGGSGLRVAFGTNSNPFNNSTYMYFDDNGEIGMGTRNPSEKLHVVGNICATGSIGSCSDERFKSDIHGIEDALARIEQVNGVEFKWKRDQYPEYDFTEKGQVGFIAQDLKKIFPEVVAVGSDGYHTIDYGKLTPVLVEAVKQLKSQNEQKDKKIEDLSRRLAKIESMLETEMK